LAAILRSFSQASQVVIAINPISPILAARWQLIDRSAAQAGKPEMINDCETKLDNLKK